MGDEQTINIMDAEPKISPMENETRTENKAAEQIEAVSQDAEKTTGRLEAFSDGVFAIAVTLLILDIKVPQSSDLAQTHQSLKDALLQQWPSYAAYLISFVTILIMWINHHNVFKHIIKTDHAFLLLNGFLLLVVTTIPFPTSLMAEYIQDAGNKDNQTLATVIYCVTNVFLAISFNLLWRYAIYNNRLLSKDANRDAIDAISRQYRYGPLIYLITVLAAFINVWLSLALVSILAIFFALPSSLSRWTK